MLILQVSCPKDFSFAYALFSFSLVFSYFI